MTLSPRVPDLSSLELLLDVARSGSIGAAAATHGISQPAASNRIRTMERLIGATLLDRTSRGSHLTAAGAVVVEWATAVVEAAGALDVGIDTLRDHRDCLLKVASSRTIADYLLPGWLIRLRARRPEATLSLVVENSAEVGRAVLRGDVELGFVAGPKVWPGLRAATIAADRLVLVVAPSHDWARCGMGVSARELAATALISREKGSGTRDTVARALRPYGEQPTPLMELSSATVIKAAVMSGEGPAVMSRLAVSEELKSGALVAVPVDGADFTRRLRVVWTAETRPDGLAAELLDVVSRLRDPA